MTPERFTPGMRIANYVVERELARGGQGVVLEAKHASLGTRVALKLLLDRDPESRARFLLEARTLARLQHPNLLRVSDHGELPSGAPYLAMDFVAEWYRQVVAHSKPGNKTRLRAEERLRELGR